MTVVATRVLRLFPSAKWVAGWAMLAGFYLLLAWKSETAEIVCAALCGTLAASIWLAIWAQPGEGFRFAWILPMLRIFRRVVTDTGIIALALLRALFGRVPRGREASVPCHFGAEDAEADARRALVLAGISLAPNSYALVLDRERQCVLIHQLVPVDLPASGDRSWPL